MAAKKKKVDDPETQAKLATYKTQIQEETPELQAAARRHLKAIVRIGQVVLKVKQEIGHGNLKPWVEQHCGFSFRSSQRYSQAARENEGVDIDSLPDAEVERRLASAYGRKPDKEKADSPANGMSFDDFRLSRDEFTRHQRAASYLPFRFDAGSPERKHLDRAVDKFLGTAERGGIFHREADSLWRALNDPTISRVAVAVALFEQCKLEMDSDRVVRLVDDELARAMHGVQTEEPVQQLQEASVLNPE